MSADLGPVTHGEPPWAPDFTVTVLAPLADPETRRDLERPEAAVADVLAAVTRSPGAPTTHIVPVRHLSPPDGQGSERRHRAEILDATTLEDVAAAFGAHSSRVVHAVGWEAGVIASALRQSSLGEHARARAAVLVESLGVPGDPEWGLAEHAGALVVQSPVHRRHALRHGVPAAVVQVVPPAAPGCPTDTPGNAPVRGRLVAVVGDGLGPGVLEMVERVLLASADTQVVFAGAAGRDVRERRHATVVRGWPEPCRRRVRSAARVGWPLLLRVDAVVDVSTAAGVPRAALAAMAAGRVVVTVGDGPAAEYVVPGRTGHVVPGNDPARMAVAVRHGLADPAVVARMGREAYAHWAGEHAPAVRARRLAQLYGDLAAAPG